MQARNRRLTSFLAVATVVAVLPAAVSAAAPFKEFPETGTEAMAYFEADPDVWMDGPVDYVILDAEQKVFKGLSSTEERADFIADFWDLRDEDQKVAGNNFKRLFYERVAMTNDRYHDFPRGWKSDRGFVHIVLGRPDYIRPVFGYSADAVVWTYFTVGERGAERGFDSVYGQVAIAFVRNAARSSYRIYGGFGGPGYVPLYVRDALQYAKEAAVVNAD